MILDSEEQKQELLSILQIVPIQGTFSQGIQQMVQRLGQLIETVKNAKIYDGITVNQKEQK
jgi:hypothetical protein